MATWYLSADIGDDTLGDGSESAPWLTISKAHDSAADGDTIICLDSTNTYTWVNQSYTKSLTVQGQQDDASGAVFDANNQSIAWAPAADGVNLVIEKLKFQNTYATAKCFSIPSATNVVTVTMNNCYFNGISGGGGTWYTSWFLYGGGGAPATINYNNCLFKEITNSGNYLFVARGSNYTTNVTGCTIYISATQSSVTPVVGYEYESGTVNFKNVIIKNDSSSSVQTTAGVNATYTCFYNLDSYPSGTGVITSDPLFVDPANGNFNLRPSSPCIDAGVLI